MPTAFSRTKEESDASYSYLSFYKSLNLVTAADVVTNFPLDFEGEVVRLDVVVSDAVTTASDAATFGIEINSTAVTGASVATTSANMTPIGAIVSGAATANNTFTSSDTLSIVASSVTDYAEGSVMLVVTLKRKG